MNKNIKNHICINGKMIYMESYCKFKDRPIIIFLHDSLGCVRLWRDFPHQISKITNCNILMYDRLGYGQSEKMNSQQRQNDYLELEAEFLNEILDYLDIKKAILFGHSDGGSIALIAAGKFPNKISALICEAAHIFVEDITILGINQAIKIYRTTNLLDKLEKYHGDKAEEVFKSWTETWTQKSFKTWNIEHFIKKITCPLLFIQGDCDEYGTMEQVDKTIKLTEGISQKFILKNIGHTPHKQAPEKIFFRVNLFLKEFYN